MKFQSHVPNFIDTDPIIPRKKFKNIHELLKDPWIQGWNDPEKEEFAYFWSSNEGSWSVATLMAQWKEKGEWHWWVLGYMDEIPESLPQWECPDPEKVRRQNEQDKPNEISEALFSFFDEAFDDIRKDIAKEIKERENK